ncbi:MAG: multiheme c-type cytochrome [Planctomycetaceae bacterium]
MTKSVAVILVVGIAAIIVAMTLFRDPKKNETFDVDQHQLEVSSIKPNSIAVTRPPEPSSGFAGSDACRSCHKEISETYSAHPMGRSMAVATDSLPEVAGEASRFTVADKHQTGYAFEYTSFLENGVLMHREAAIRGDSKQPIYQHDEVVDFVVGSGTRGKSYLINHDGILIMSPLTWYTEGHRWDLSPGYELQNRHFQRRIVDGCLQCHASRVASRPESTHLFEKKPFHELAIGCERCHGPGQTHIHFHTSSQPPDDAIDPIVNPARLDTQRRDHVCLQCHLIGESRLLRYGRTDFDFRPGDRVTDIWTTFMKGAVVEADQTAEAVSQVEQMLSSTCYLKSSDFGCVTCHDPHRQPEESNKHTFYRNRCLQCHDAPDTDCSESEPTRNAITNPDSCISCHMQSQEANNVPHLSQTDHRILRRPLNPVDHNPESMHYEVKIFGLKDAQIPKPELDRAHAIFMVETAESKKNPLLAAQAIPGLEEWVRNVPDDLAALDALGAAYSLLDERTAAEQAWQSGMRLMPTDERFLRRLFFHYHDHERLQEAVQIGDRLLAVNSWDPEYLGRMAHLLGQAGQLPQALEYAKRAVELNPRAVRVHGWLADAYSALGNKEASAEHAAILKLLTD